MYPYTKKGITNRTAPLSSTTFSSCLSNDNPIYYLVNSLTLAATLFSAKLCWSSYFQRLGNLQWRNDLYLFKLEGNSVFRLKCFNFDLYSSLSMLFYVNSSVEVVLPNKISSQYFVHDFLLIKLKWERNFVLIIFKLPFPKIGK